MVLWSGGLVVVKKGQMALLFFLIFFLIVRKIATPGSRVIGLAGHFLSGKWGGVGVRVEVGGTS